MTVGQVIAKIDTGTPPAVVMQRSCPAPRVLGGQCVTSFSGIPSRSGSLCDTTHLHAHPTRLHCCQRLSPLLARHAEGSAQPAAKPAEDKEPAKAEPPEPAQQSSKEEKAAEPELAPPPEPAQTQQESEPVSVGVWSCC